MENALHKKDHLEKILQKMAEILDITPTQHEQAVQKYEAVTNYLKEDETISGYGLQMYPQGSFSLGTVTKPDLDDDELDIDIVCELTLGTSLNFTQTDLKTMIGNRLKSGRYGSMLTTPDGRRCWRINYAEETKFHLDILPAIPDTLTKVEFLHKTSYSSTAISITDKEHYAYRIFNDNWPKSNPKGYLAWFKQQMIVQLNENKRMFSVNNKVKIEDVPDYKVKTPLQRVIQILKRHRNEMFCNNPSLNYDDKPISIIITTLAAKAYANEDNLYDALINILDGMPNHISKKNVAGKAVTWVENPVDSRENFADKWEAFPIREQNFYKWITAARTYFHELLQKEGIQMLNESLKKGFGDKLITKAFSAIGDETRIFREQGSLKMQGGTGLLGLLGTQKVINHTFHGKKEQ